MVEDFLKAKWVTDFPFISESAVGYIKELHFRSLGKSVLPTRIIQLLEAEYIPSRDKLVY